MYYYTHSFNCLVTIFVQMFPQLETKQIKIMVAFLEHLDTDRGLLLSQFLNSGQLHVKKTTFPFSALELSSINYKLETKRKIMRFHPRFFQVDVQVKELRSNNPAEEKTSYNQVFGKPIDIAGSIVQFLVSSCKVTCSKRICKQQL